MYFAENRFPSPGAGFFQIMLCRTIVSDSRRYCGRAVDATGGAVFNGRETSSRCCHVPELAFEDFTPGRVFDHGPRGLPRDEMISFAAEFDPQPMHLDEAAARQSMLGGLSASGWYLCCILMRMTVDAFVGRSASMGAPGVDEVRWLLPVRPDDELSLRATVLETRASKSRPDMGFVKFEFVLLKGDKPAVMLTTSLMLGRRVKAVS
jgi:acyl dehydratase